MKYSMPVFMMAVLTAFSFSGFGQGNFVPNGGFDDTDARVKKVGQLELATGWVSPTEDQPDLYSERCKKGCGTLENNVYGTQSPMSGENYAGIRVYADREAKPRTYLQSRFTKSLKEGKTYCVKFHVSLADIAKYGTNNMGAYISKKQITQKEILEYDITPHVVHSRRIVYDDQYDWVEICGTYKAAGGEKFITIGNFAKQTDIETKRMKRPRGITGVQTRDSYYYIDDVSVLNMAELESCDCEKTDDGQQFAVQYTKNISEDNTLDDSRLIELKQVHFGSLKTAVEESEYAALEEVVKLLTSNEAIKLQVVGHTDNIEQLKAKNNVSKQRAEAVVAYLVSKGIAADRLTAVGNDDKDSLTDDQTASGLAQNRRVQFKVVE